MSPDEIFALATHARREGHAFEAQGTPDALAEALRCYERAIGALRSLPIADPRARHGLALALMNRGNALQRQRTEASLAAAVQCYDEAIAFFRTLPLAANPDLRNSLGAAWMNRGHALLVQPDAPALAEAVRSQREAVAILRTVPLDAHPSHRVNLAGSLMNEANALLLVDDPATAADRARDAIGVAQPGESADALLADLGLKARRALCEAIGRLLARPGESAERVDALADEASDVVDAGLALTRHWETRGMPHLRPVAVRLYRFGAELHRLHLPDFLAEFLLEHIDPEHAAGAVADDGELYAIAFDALNAARQDLETRRTVFLQTPDTARLLERWQTLREAETRLAALRERHLPKTANSGAPPAGRT
jgi:tetratricopeptide (TPR) repeat protein